MTNKLKPCPFCGSEPYIRGEEYLRTLYYGVKCRCGAETAAKATEAEAIAAWNTRACDECERGAIPATEENMAEHGWVKVVRCKDCRFYEKGDTRWWCVKSITLVPEPDCFCAWGRRKVVEYDKDQRR